MEGKRHVSSHRFPLRTMKYSFVTIAVHILLSTKCFAQINRPPEFTRGGDMAKFSISEDTPVGSSVYTLRARDPENGRVTYYISGDHFTAEKNTGIVRLVRPLDRERENTIDVIISVSDEKYNRLEPNTISIKREITVLDRNDNAPIFLNMPYRFSVDETTSIGSTVYKGILVSDADVGLNAKIQLICANKLSPLSCQRFGLKFFEDNNGRVHGEITLKAELDYEEASKYTMTLVAQDMSLERRLNTTVDAIIEVQDIQDQPPVFLNSPYTATVMENSERGQSIFTVTLRDGDTGNPRQLALFTQDDKNHFRIGKMTENNNVLTAILETNEPIDREGEDILKNGGLYVFQLKAVELIEEEPSGESTIVNVTIVVGDVNDQVPTFNEMEFSTTVPEDLGFNTPLPGLNIVVYDMDVGDNAKFSLHLENILNSEGVFSVFPPTAIGRTPVVIRIADAAKLDFENPDKRTFVFQIVASQGINENRATVTVTLSDANDNAPVFGSDQYIFQVPENAAPNSSIFTLPAFDADSGVFGQVRYSLRGFGSDKINVVPETGEILVMDCGRKTCLDYEMQKSYSLTYEAQDGGGKSTTVNIFIEIVDSNDNAPQFAKDVYSRNIQENTDSIRPPLFIKATDADGPYQGGGRVAYRILSSDLQDSKALDINEESGEVFLRRPLKFSEVPNSSGLVTIVIEAKDKGNPPLASTAKLILKVKKENEGAPEFVNQPYRTTIQENARTGTSVFRVTASDPDGPDSSLSYYLHSGAKDNFIVDQRSGVLIVARGADLDRDLYGSEYQITVHAVDSGIPIQQTATATVYITVEDVNNKPPKFIEESYVTHIAEGLKVGEEVIRVSATDPDTESRLRYSISEPISARDKTGALVKSNSAYNYKEAFTINSVTGKITVNKPLDYNSASVIILTIDAIDLNAIDAASGNIQKTSVEVTVYIRAEGEMNPVFSPPWTQANPVIEISLPEEALVGSTLLTVSARDPLTHQPVTQYKKLSGSDPDNYVSVSPVSGVVSLNRRLDFEDLNKKYISFKVNAIIGDPKSQRVSVATIIINVQDVNDNSPVFHQNSYMSSVSELSIHPQPLLTVQASDKDSQNGYGTIRYSVSGEGSNVFVIDDITGTIYVKENATLDRELQSVYNLQVTATDNPEGLTNQRRTSVLVALKILDENDNAPKFGQEIYSAVVPENVPSDFSVVTVNAQDADSGQNGELYYAKVDESDELSSLFEVNSNTGRVSVVKSLSGKGRSQPYKIKIRATDKGSPPLHSDCHLLVVIADISTNDGVPQFIRPVAGEIAYVHENVTVGAEIFQVVAFDPDNPNTANGKVAFKLVDDMDAGNLKYGFKIDAATGLITTQAPLDREKKENYTMIIIAHDFGFPPQEAQRVLRITLLDVDDSNPQFTRPLRSQPIEVVLKEEVPVGTVVEKLQAVDNDTGPNSIIHYYIIDGNEDGLFGVRRTMDNEGEIVVQKRIDGENVTKFTLTIKVSKPSQSLEGLTKTYDYTDLSEIQITILIEDIDDNPPMFDTSSYVLGAKVETPIETELVKLQAYDPDSSSQDIVYNIKNTTFIRPITEEMKYIADAFYIDPKTGALTNILPLWQFVGGYFDIVVEAKSSPGMKNMALAHVKVHILQDRDLLKFVFYKRPNEVRDSIPQLQKDLKLVLAQPISLNVYDTQFYSRNDGSLDFESTSSCFQLLQNNVLIEPKKVKKILNQKKSPEIMKLYQNYSIVAVESCAPIRKMYKMSWSEILVLVIAALIVIITFVACIALCSIYSSYKQKLNKCYFHNVYMTNNGAHPTNLSPAEQQRIYEWQEMNAPLADAASFRSYPTLR